MKTKWQKLLALLAALFVAVGMGGSSKVYSNTENITLSLVNYYSNPRRFDDQSEFETEKSIPAALDIRISSANLPAGTKIRITVPKSDGKIQMLGPSLDQFFTNPETNSNKTGLATQDAENWYMTYTYKEKIDAEGFTPNFPFKFIYDKTSNGDSVTIKAELLDAVDNTKVLHSTSKTYVAKVPEMPITDGIAYLEAPISYIADNPTLPIRHNRRYIINKTVNEGENTVGEVDELLTFRAAFNPDFPNALDQKIKVQSASNVVYEVTIPEGYELADNQAWQWDPVTRKATFTFTNVSNESFSRVYVQPPYKHVTEGYDGPDGKIGLTAPLKVKGRNIAFDTVQKFPVTYTVNKGEANEYKLPDRSVNLLYTKNIFAKSVGSGFKRYAYGGFSLADNKTYTASYNRPYAYDPGLNIESDLLWHVQVHNQNTGSSARVATGGLTTAVYSITENLGSTPDDKRMYFTSFTLRGFNQGEGENPSVKLTEAEQAERLNAAKAKAVKNTLYGIKEDGSKVVIKKNIDIGEKVPINDVEQIYSKIKLEFDEPVILDNTTLYYQAPRALSQEEISKFNDGTYTQYQTYTLVGEVANHEGDSHPASETDSSVVHSPINAASHYEAFSNTVSKPIPLFSHDYYGRGFSTDLSIGYSDKGTTFTHLSTSHADGNWVGTMAQETVTQKKMFLLPPGYDYDSHKSNEGFGTQKPEVIRNFRDTGKTAVIFTQDYQYSNIKTNWFGGTVTFRILPGAPDGESQIETYTYWSDDRVLATGRAELMATDEFDLDNDGNTTEKFLKHTRTINYVLPFEMSLSKTVSYGNPDALTMDATGELGEPFYYRLSLFNNDAVKSAKNVNLIDVLPYVGDHQIRENQNGEYLPRGSRFATPLVEFLENIPQNAEALTYFDVFYQLTPQGADTASVTNGEWLTKDQVGADRLKQVKSIKYTIKPGKEMEAGKRIIFYLKSEIPKDAIAEAGNYAVNTSAFSSDGRPYLESNRASITFGKYEVNGVYFNDFNKDGVKDTNEPPVPGQTVELIDEATGQVALDTNGQPLRTTTNDMGGYSFTLYKRGDYKVRFVKPDDAVFSMTQGTTGDILNHLAEENGNTATTKVVTVNPATPTARLNGAMTIEKRDIELVKQDQDGAPLAGAVFELRQAGLAIQTQTTNNEGKLIFRQVPFGTYTIVETKAPTGYSMEESPAGRSVTVDANVIELAPFVNRQIKGQVTLTKVDADNAAKKLANVTFVLKQGDEVKYTATTNDQGIATFTDVLYGDYTLVETETQADYVLSTETKAVKVETQGQIVNLGNITNTIRKGRVLTKYVNEDNVEIKGMNTQAGLPIHSTYNTTKDNEIEHDGKVYRLDTTKLPANATGTVIEGDITVVYTYKLVKGHVETTYVNEENVEIKTKHTQSDLPVKSSYSTVKDNEIEHDGKVYRLDDANLPTNATGQVTEGTTKVVYRYKLVKGHVETTYVNEDGVEIKTKHTQSDLPVKSSYSTVKDNEIEHDGKVYRLDETQLPANATGQVTEGTTKVVYRYKLVKGHVETTYVNEDGVEIKTKHTQSDLPVKSSYSTVKDNEIEHDGKIYRLDTTQLPANATGQVTEGTTKVVYRYKLIKGDIVTRYVNEEGVEIKTSDTQTGLPINSTYNTTKDNEIEHDGKVYRLDETQFPANATGTVTEAGSIVTYVYKLVKGNVETTYVNEDGIEIKTKHTQSDLPIKSTYTTTKDNEIEHDGKVYRLDETQLPTNATGQVTEGTTKVVYTYKLIKGDVVTKFVNEEGVEIQDPTTQAGLPVLSTYTTDKPARIDYQGKVYLLKEDALPANATGQVTESTTTVTYTYYLATSGVITEYVDQTGTALQPSTTQTDLPVNSTYTTTAPNEITTTTGLLYRLAQDQLPANATGTVIDTVTTVTYRYRPVEGTVTVRYINVETGEELQDPTLPYNPATVGSSYDVTTEAPATIRKGNDDYDLVGLQSGQETGTIIEGNIEVVYGYKYVLKKGSVVVHFIDEATGQPVQGAANPINDADEGTDYDVSDVPPATIVRGTTTYTLVGLQDGSSATGQITAGVTNVTYVYREVPKRGSVTVHFIDEATGQPIQDPTTPVNDVVVTAPYDVTGQAPAEITVGGVTYTLVGLQAGSSATGQVTEGTTNVTYVYRQVPKRGSVTVHFIDKTTGKAIQAPVTPVSDVVVTTPYDVTGQAPAEITVGGKRYKLVGLQSGQATGQVVEGDTTVIYAYEEIVEITPPTPDPVPTPDPTPTPEPAPTPEPSQPAAPAPQKVLPKTGQASSAWVAGLGFLLLAMTSLLAFKTRRD